MKDKSWKIRYTQLAYSDLDEIDDYISEKLCNPHAAEKLLSDMETSIQRLEQYPMIGPEVEDPYLTSKGYRKLVVRNYLIFYLLNPGRHEVIIMRVLYGAREYHNLL